MGSPELEVHHLCQDLDCRTGHCCYPSWVARQGGIPPQSQTALLPQPRDPVWAIHGLDGGLCEGVPSSLSAREEVEGCSSLCLPSQDEYMADLYHFSTKEDSYASYFIRVSPLLHSSSVCEYLLGYV